MHKKKSAHDNKAAPEKAKPKRSNFFELFWILLTIFLLISIGVIYVFSNYFEKYLDPFTHRSNQSRVQGQNRADQGTSDILTEETGFSVKYDERFLVRTFQGDFYFNLSDARSSGITAKSLVMTPEFFGRIYSRLFRSFSLNVTDSNSFGYYASYITFGNVTIRGDFNPKIGDMKFNSRDLDFGRKECGELSKDLYIYSANVTDVRIDDGIVGVKFIANCNKMPIQGYMEFYFTATRKLFH